MNKAPDFTLSYIDQPGTYQLSKHLGKVIVLTFWTSWCPDCSHDLPLKERLYQASTNEAIVFITINVSGREPNQEEARRYYHQFLTQPTLVDHGLETYRAYNCLGVPTTVIIDQTGFIIKTFSDQARPLQIMEALAPFLSEN